LPGICGSRNATPRDFRDVIRWLESGRFPVDDLITRTVRLADAGDALRQWSENPAAVTKIQVAF
jgi:threonine dehydrogenase-like Zn-dependent dehydrogenase